MLREKSSARLPRREAALPALCVAVLLAGVPLYGQLAAAQKQLNLDSFETVWTTIRDKHWDKNPGGLDWQAVHDELRPKSKTPRDWYASSLLMTPVDALDSLHVCCDELGSGEGAEAQEARCLLDRQRGEFREVAHVSSWIDGTRKKPSTAAGALASASDWSSPGRGTSSLRVLATSTT